LSAKASGKQVKLFGVASKAKWDMLKAAPYGYSHLADYKDQDWPQRIRELSGGAGMHYAYDCISEGDTVARVSSTLSSYGSIAIVRSRAAGAWKPDGVTAEPVYGAVWEGLGKEVQYQGFTVKESAEAREFAVEFYKWLTGAVGDVLTPNPIRLMPGGLERVVEDGFRLLGNGSMGKRARDRNEEWMKPISAEKLVYKLSSGF
jgi:NADPH:quinone reductase-like Zn-dependent oxidoreductase